MAKRYDYLIVGAGTAGCTLAHRLSEDGTASVLLVEAGGDDRHWIIQMPAGLRSAFRPRSRFNWWYRTVAQPQLDGRVVDQPRGRVLGGSSSINGMTFLRGNPLDYDHWATELGCRGWSFAECLPYFRRLERYHGPASAFRGTAGPVGVQRQRDLSPLNAAFLAACKQAGHPFSEDVNGYRQEGAGRFDMSVERGYRSSAARAFVHTQPRRPNLRIRRNTRVLRVLVERGRAVGVRLAHGNGASEDVFAGVEVIMSAGVFATPQLLMVSGIGPARHLEAMGVDVACDAPGVGENLQDHLEAHVQVEGGAGVSLNRELAAHRMLWAGLQWFGARRGVAAVNQCHVGAFLRTQATVTHPNIQMHFFPVFFGAQWLPDRHRDGDRLGVGPLRPQSRGRVRLRSGDPRDPPLIDPNYLAAERDRQEMREGLRLAREILAQPAFRPYHRREDSPGPAVTSDGALDAFIRRHATTAFHPCGTCRMGPDDDDTAVVDTSLRLRGVDGLRIVDASVIPRIPSANINATVFMLAEKASDLIRGRQPLAPEPVDFYRANVVAGSAADRRGRAEDIGMAGRAGRRRAGTAGPSG